MLYSGCNFTGNVKDNALRIKESAPWLKARMDGFPAFMPRPIPAGRVPLQAQERMRRTPYQARWYREEPFVPAWMKGIFSFLTDKSKERMS